MRILTAFFALVLLALAITTTKVQTVRAYSLTNFTGAVTFGSYTDCRACEIAADETFGICRCWHDSNGDIFVIKFTTNPTSITATGPSDRYGTGFAIYNGATTKIVAYEGPDIKVYDTDLANPATVTPASDINYEQAEVVVDVATGKAYITDDSSSNVGDGTNGPKVHTFSGLADTPDSTTTSATITATGAVNARDLILVGSDLFVQVANDNGGAPGLARLTTGSSLTYVTTVFATSGNRFNGRALAASSTTIYMSDYDGDLIHRWAVSPFAYTSAVSVEGSLRAQLMWSPDDKVLILCSEVWTSLTMVDPSNNLTVVGNRPTIGSGNGANCKAIMTLSKSQKKIVVIAGQSTFDAYFFQYEGPTTTTTTTTTSTTTTTTTETATTSLAPVTTTPSPNGAGHISASAVAALSFVVSAFLVVM